MQPGVKDFKHKWISLSAAFATATMLFPVAAHATESSSLPANSLVQTFQLPSSVHMPLAPKVTAESVFLMDADNGQILYEKNQNARRAPASTTKIMTMLLVMEALNSGKIHWSDIVPVTPDAYKVAQEPGVSDAYLDPRQKITLQEMMTYVAVLSANDATVAVADYVGGDMNGFVQMMNQEAQKLGMTNTHYMNADGLPVSNHYSTAHDLAILARYLVEKYPEILQYTSQTKVSVPDMAGKSHTWPNTDDIVGKYPGLDGLKTGFTDAAGYCFVGTATQNGVRLVSVVMGCPTNADRFSDTQALLDYGFHQFTEDKPVVAGQNWTSKSVTASVPDGKQDTVAIVPSQSLIVDLPTGVKGSLNVQVNPVNAPVTKGQTVGKLQYVVDNQVVSQDDLVAATSDGRANIIVRTWRHLTHSIGSWFHHLLHRK